MPLDAAPVHEGAVHRAEVTDFEAVADALEAGVTSRHLVDAEHHIAFRRAAGHDLVTLPRDDALELVLVLHDEAGVQGRLLGWRRRLGNRRRCRRDRHDCGRRGRGVGLVGERPDEVEVEFG